MGAVREYIIGIGAAAMICGILLSFSEKGSMAPLLKLICGLVLSFAILNPLLSIVRGDWENLGITLPGEGEKATEEGKKQAQKSVQTLIKEETEAYILDKARDMDLTVRVSVRLSEEAMPTPDFVTVYGTVPPYQKAQLSRMLAEELGLGQENQQWISGS